MHVVDGDRGAAGLEGRDRNVAQPDRLFDQRAGAVEELAENTEVAVNLLFEIRLARGPVKIILITQPLYDGFDV